MAAQQGCFEPRGSPNSPSAHAACHLAPCHLQYHACPVFTLGLPTVILQSPALPPCTFTQCHTCTFGLSQASTFVHACIELMVSSHYLTVSSWQLGCRPAGCQLSDSPPWVPWLEALVTQMHSLKLHPAISERRFYLGTGNMLPTVSALAHPHQPVAMSAPDSFAAFQIGIHMSQQDWSDPSHGTGADFRSVLKTPSP